METFEGSKSVYLVMEYVDGKDLFDYIHEKVVPGGVMLDERFSMVIMRQVFSALHYCHELDVIHRDLKPENIMVQRQKGSAFERTMPSNGIGCPSWGSALPEELQVKLIDFGLAIVATRAKPALSLVGTCDYLAPEVQKGKLPSAASDLWAAGVVMHCLLTGLLPKEEVRGGLEVIDLKHGIYSHISRNTKELLGMIFRIDPGKRCSAGEAFECEWLGGEEDLLDEEKRTAALDQSTIQQFIAFHQSNLLKKAVLTALAMQLGSQQIMDVREQFMRADKDGNARISREEFIASLSEGSGNLTEDVRDWMEKVFDSIDTDESEEIEYTEWLAAALEQGKVRAEASLRSAFRVFDSDGSGKISKVEFAQVVAQTPAEIAGYMGEFDSDGDGQLDFDEFKIMLTSGLDKSPSGRMDGDGSPANKLNIESVPPPPPNGKGLPKPAQPAQGGSETDKGRPARKPSVGPSLSSCNVM
jgi:calcium-dependent protein kinase